MLHILHGPDDFSIQEYLDHLKADVGTPDLLDANVTRIQASASSLEQIIAMCSTVPFLASRRMVILEGLLALSEGRRASRRTANAKDPLSSWLPIVDYIPTMPPSTDLVLLNGEVRRNNALLTKLSPLGRVREFPSLRGHQLGQWIQVRARQRNCTISAEGIRLLTDLVGGNLWSLSSEIEKLSLYCPDRTVQVEDVQLLVPLTREMSIFNAVDAILEGNYSEALGTIRHLMERGATGQTIVTMTARQVRLLLLARDLTGRGVPHEQMGQRLGLQSPWVLNKVREQARRHSIASLESLHRGLLEADQAMKTGRILENAMGEFLVEIFAEVASEQQPARSNSTGKQAMSRT